MTTQPGSQAAPKRSIWTPRRIVLAVIVLYVVVLVLVNRNSVAVNFVFFKTEASLFVVVLLAIALGFVAGWLFDDLRALRKRNKRNAG